MLRAMVMPVSTGLLARLRRTGENVFWLRGGAGETEAPTPFQVS